MITNDRRVVFDVVARVAATAVAARVVDCVSAACIVVECAARARAIHGEARGVDPDVRGVYRYTVPAFESVLTPSIDTYIHRRDGQRSARAIGSRAARRGFFYRCLIRIRVTFMAMHSSEPCDRSES